MVLRKWNKLFVRTEPSRGLEMFLVEKLVSADPQDMRWTAVDPVLRVQVVNLRNKGVYALKAARVVTYAP
eukprot:6926454-Lingulodinium_polyedra.AAC.1